LLRGLRGEHTVLISSHILTEISQTCDRLLVIQGGELVGQGTEDELAQAMGRGGSVIEVEVKGQPAGMLDRLAGVAGVSKARVSASSDGATTFEIVASADVRAEVARLLVTGGCDLLRLERNERRLESIFMSLTQQPTGGPQ